MEIGKVNKMRVVKELDFGIYLDGDDFGEILMPLRYVPKNAQPETEIECFVYLDSEDRYIATTERPKAMVGEFACLKCVAVNNVGAFLDWGLPKDLLVPFSEQKAKMEEGRYYVVFIYVDSITKRIAASSKINKYLDNVPADYEENQSVELFVVNPTDLGFNVIINGLHSAMLYKNEVFQELKRGQNIKGFIKKLREDEKIDVCLQKGGFEKVDSLTDDIIHKLLENDGFMLINDKTSAEEIQEIFRCSKKTFKKALGALYKKKIILIEDGGIRLIQENKD